MIWNDHSKLEGQHAFLGASNYHWINWSDEIFWQRYISQFSKEVGTAIHELAQTCITNRIKLNKQDKHIIDLCMCNNHIPSLAYNSEVILTNLLPFVNDAIGFHMSSEIILYYSPICFGTTDAISYSEKDRYLRIHDLKTGTVPAKMEQLEIYAALFCLEYHKDPTKINIELRIYQNGEVLVDNPDPKIIEKFMLLIKNRTELIKKLL